MFLTVKTTVKILVLAISTTINHTNEDSLNFSSNSSKTINNDNTSSNIENSESIGFSYFKRKDFDSKLVRNGESLLNRSETLKILIVFLLVK